MRVLVDDGILRGFAARARLFYPLEHAEFLWGHKDEDDFVVTIIDCASEVDADEEEIEVGNPYEFGDVVNGQTLFGTIHSHPNWTCVPSPTDLESAAEPPSETVFGIMSLTKSGNRWLTGYAFYLTDGTQVELVVSKPEKMKGKRNGVRVLP